MVPRQSAIERAMWDLAERREDTLREVVRERLPRPLRWASDHPRVLRVLYRLRPAWRPTIVYGHDLGITVGSVKREDGTTAVFIHDQFWTR